MLNEESNSIFRFRIQSELHHLWPKNYRPPHPMGVKGGCSPQNNRENFVPSKRASSRWQQLYTKIFFTAFPPLSRRDKHKKSVIEKKSTNKSEQEAWRRRKAQARRGCTSVRRGF